MNLDYLSSGVQVQDFVMTELKSKMYKLVQQLEKFGGDDKAKLNTREEHPEWFEGKNLIILLLIIENQLSFLA